MSPAVSVVTGLGAVALLFTGWWGARQRAWAQTLAERVADRDALAQRLAALEQGARALRAEVDEARAQARVTEQVQESLERSRAQTRRLAAQVHELMREQEALDATVQRQLTQVALDTERATIELSARVRMAAEQVRALSPQLADDIADALGQLQVVNATRQRIERARRAMAERNEILGLLPDHLTASPAEAAPLTARLTAAREAYDTAEQRLSADNVGGTGDDNTDLAKLDLF